MSGPRGELLGSGEVELGGGEALGKRPVDGGRVAGAAGVDPVDVPVFFEGEDEADLEGFAGGDVGGERG